MPDEVRDTASNEYAERLRRKESSLLKRVIPVQAPYRWNIRRLVTGPTLDVGCGLGRNLAHLPAGSVGVDHNAESIAEARRRGLEAYTSQEFAAAVGQRRFDSMVVAHVLEHVDEPLGDELMREYVSWLNPGSTVVLICPQEVGYRSDASHVRWVDFQGLAATLSRAGFAVERSFSFPFPRMVGRIFIYNEFVVTGRVPASGVS